MKSLVATVAAIAWCGIALDAQSPSVKELIPKATAYAHQFVDKFINVVAEERYEQEITSPKRKRVLMSDFLLEGFLLGSIGAGFGVFLGLLVAELINKAEIVYHPPFVPFYAKLEVLVLQNPASIAASFSGSLLVAVLASLPAARRAARMNIADALRS